MQVQAARPWSGSSALRARGLAPSSKGSESAAAGVETREWTVVSSAPLPTLDPGTFHQAPLRVDLGGYPSRKLAVVVSSPDPAPSLNVASGAAALSQLKQQLETLGRPVDLLIFANGSQQRLETAHALAPLARYTLGSQENAPVPLDRLLPGLAGREPEAAARAWVRDYARLVPSGMQSALRSEASRPLAASLKELCRHLQTDEVDPALIYTSMLRVPAMARDSRDPDFHQRDLGAFLQTIIQDSRYPEAVRDAAVHTRRHYERCVLAQHSSPDRQAMRRSSGANLLMPWKPLGGAERQAYATHSWAADSGWLDLLDRVFARPSAPVPTPAASSLGQWLFREYKTYISPQQELRCAYTPSCSQFAREAIEKYGLWEGSKVGLLRFFSCDGSHLGSDPLPGQAVAEHAHCHHHEPVAPPLSRPGAAPQAGFWSELLVSGGRLAGQLLGGFGLGLAGLPLGLAVGAQAGYAAGSGRRPHQLQELAGRYTESVARGYERITAPVAGAVTGLGAGPWAGAALGGLLGALGGAWGGIRWGGHFGGLWLENRAKEQLGQLPPNPMAQAAIVQSA